MRIQRRRASWKLFLLVVAVPLGACLDQPETATVERASTTSGHLGASDYTYNNTCAWMYTAPQAGLTAEDTADRYGVDPDCGVTSSSASYPMPNGTTRRMGDCINSWPPDPAWSINSANSLLTSCYNYDHFSQNNFGLENNATMQQILLGAASQSASAGDQQGALRRSFEACHYAVDANQCGHSFGNMVCNPLGPVTQECVDFYNQFAAIGTQYGGNSTSNIWWGCDIFSDSVAYAAAERYIRHHNPGLLLDNPAWVNGCPNNCPGGDSDGGGADACQKGGNNSDQFACQNTVQQTCNQMCTPLTCAQLGYPTTMVLQCGRDMCCTDDACPSGYHCNSQNECEQVCSAILPQCGPYTDSCGNQKIRYCDPGYDCQGNTCVPSCNASPPECGPYTDSCGHTYAGATCPDGYSCTSGTCTQVCTAIVPQCGIYYDSCGYPHDAGGCAGGTCVGGACCTASPPQCGAYTDSCGYGHAGNACPDGYSCTSGTCTQVCSALVPQCGTYYDSCGYPHDAGGCPGGEHCVDNACTACSASPPQCGAYYDDCGNWYPGNGCADGYQCTGGTCTQVCTAVVPQCGAYYDSCGNWFPGDGCPDGYDCNGGSCQPSCTASPPECGAYYDSCGNWFPGNGCPDGYDCNGGSCQPSCTASPPECGAYYDSCGNWYPGNGCPDGTECDGGSCQQIQSCISYPPECGGYYDTCGNYYGGYDCGYDYYCDNGTCQYDPYGGGGGDQCDIFLEWGDYWDWYYCEYYGYYGYY